MSKISCDNYDSIDQAIKGYSEALVGLDKKKQEPLDDGVELRTLLNDALICIVTKAGDPDQQKAYATRLDGWAIYPRESGSRLLADQYYNDARAELAILHTSLTIRGAATFLNAFAEGAIYHHLGCPVDSEGRSLLETNGEKMECQFLNSKAEYVQEIIEIYLKSGILVVEGNSAPPSPQIPTIVNIIQPSRMQTPKVSFHYHRDRSNPRIHYPRRTSIPPFPDVYLDFDISSFMGGGGLNITKPVGSYAGIHGLLNLGLPFNDFTGIMLEGGASLAGSWGDSNKFHAGPPYSLTISPLFYNFYDQDSHWSGPVSLGFTLGQNQLVSKNNSNPWAPHVTLGVGLMSPFKIELVFTRSLQENFGTIGMEVGGLWFNHNE